MRMLEGPYDCSVDAPEFYGSRSARLRIVCQMGDGFTLSMTDDGKSWHYESQQSACLMGCQTYRYQSGASGRVFYLDLNHAWQRTAHQEISWSVDGGKTWNKVSGPELCCDSDNIFFVDADHGWIVFGEHIARTTDGGRAWERLPVTIVPCLRIHQLPL